MQGAQIRGIAAVSQRSSGARGRTFKSPAHIRCDLREPPRVTTSACAVMSARRVRFVCGSHSGRPFAGEPHSLSSQP